MLIDVITSNVHMYNVYIMYLYQCCYDNAHVCYNYIPSLGLVLGDLSGDSFEVTEAILSTLTLSP